MGKAKKKPAGRVIVGGVNATEEQRAVLARSIRGTVEKRDGVRFRFRLDKALSTEPGERLIVDAEYETTLAVVTAVHPHNLLDVTIPAGLFDPHAHVVHVRRSPL